MPDEAPTANAPQETDWQGPELQHPLDALAAPKPPRVFVVFRTEGWEEDWGCWVAGVFEDRALAEAALGEDKGSVCAVPLNTFGKFKP